MAKKHIGVEMILFLKAHPIDQAISRSTSASNLNDGEIRRNPGEPSPKDAKDGNYKKPVVKWRGLNIRIENPAGSVRRGHNWETRMKYDYGYISGSNGADGDEVDVYIGPNLDTAENVYVVHQRKQRDWKKYDEDKAMAGFLTEDEAKAAYLAHYDDPRFLGPVTVMPTEEFIAKVKATKEQAGMIKSMVLFFKSNVKGHTRRMKSGKVVYVNPYNNKVTATVQDSGKQLSLFADNNYVDERQTDKYETIKKTEKKENKEQNIDPRKLLQTWYLLGKEVAFNFPRETSTLRPTLAEYTHAAKKLGISVAEARRAHNVYEDPKNFSIKRKPNVSNPDVLATIYQQK